MRKNDYQSQPAAGSPQAAAQLAKLAEAAAEKAKTTAVTELVRARVTQVIADKPTSVSAATTPSVASVITPSVTSNNPGTTAASRLTQLLFNKKTLSLAAIIGGATAYYLYRQRQLTIAAAKAKSDEEKAATRQEDAALFAEYAHIQPSDVPAAQSESKGIIATVTSYLPSFSLWKSPVAPAATVNTSTTLRPGQ